jgi:transcription-repair coupling factor (superfamily II helicase)
MRLVLILYTQMLERTVAELRGEQVEDETSVTLNLGVDVAIPDDYISDMGQRLRTYKRVSSARDDATLNAIRNETSDRYGRIPISVERLLTMPVCADFLRNSAFCRLIRHLTALR